MSINSEPHAVKPAVNLGNSMCHNVPEGATLKNELSVQQLKAIRLLLTGGSDSSVARELGLNRHTIHRWRTRHPAFRAELARRREALWHNNADHLRSLISRALKVLSTHMRSNYDRTSFRAAVSILRLAGANKIAPPDDPTDETEIVRNDILRDRARDANANANAAHDTTVTAAQLMERFNELLAECAPAAAPDQPTPEYHI